MTPKRIVIKPVIVVSSGIQMVDNDYVHIRNTGGEIISSVEGRVRCEMTQTYISNVPLDPLKNYVAEAMGEKPYYPPIKEEIVKKPKKKVKKKPEKKPKEFVNSINSLKNSFDN